MDCCVCLCVCACVCVLCARVRACVCVRARAYVRVFVHLCVRVFVCARANLTSDGQGVRCRRKLLCYLHVDISTRTKCSDHDPLR